jgi:hypothetical protein
MHIGAQGDPLTRDSQSFMLITLSREGKSGARMQVIGHLKSRHWWQGRHSPDQMRAIPMFSTPLTHPEGPRLKMCRLTTLVVLWM